MNSKPETDLLTIQRLSEQLHGVFTIADLHILFRSKNAATLNNRIRRLLACGSLQRFCNGIYVAPGFSPETLSAKIDPDAYLSMGYILAKNGLIGTVPAKRITAVRTGRNRRYTRAGMTIEHFGIARQIHFGFETSGGVRYADCEKAYLDVLYFSMHGRRFSFHPTADVDTGRLRADTFFAYLDKYKNTRFRTYCERVMRNERT